MKQIISFINEKLKINSQSKVNTDSGLRDLSDIKTKHFYELNYRSPSEESRDWAKAEEYFKKKSKPERLVNSIKDRNKLVRRWIIYVVLGWEEAYQVFRNEIVNRGYYTEDELDKYILDRYNKVKSFSTTLAKEREQNYKNYLDVNNVKY